MDGDPLPAWALLGSDPLSARPWRMPEVRVVDASQSRESCQGSASLRQQLPASGVNDMIEHKFVLVLSGIGELTPELADALFEATKGDLELNMREGVAYAEISRSASTLAGAVRSAIAEIEQCGQGVRVVRVESDVANTSSLGGNIDARDMANPGSRG